MKKPVERILSITDTTFDVKDRKSSYVQTFEGFVIKTDKQTIKIGVSNSQDCCERFGHLMTNDNSKEFIGAKLLKVVKVDKALNNKVLPDIESLDEGEAMFINLETSKGLLQFVVYNSHNGYYGHSAVVISKQYKESTVL